MPGTKELYDKLYAEKLYTNNYQDFVSKYGNEEGQNELYNKLYSNQLYTNDVTSFKTKYFSDLKKKEAGASPSAPLAESGSSESQPMVAPGPPVSSVTKVNKPSAYNKNIEASDWQRHQEITRKIQAAAAKKDSSAVLAAANELKSLRSVYGGSMANDKNLSEDLSITQKIVSRSLPDVDIISATALPSKKKQILVPKPLVTATGPTKERAKQESELKKFDESLNTSIDMTEDELKYMFLKDNIELGLTESGQQKLAEKEQELEEEFSDNEGLWNSSKKLYNKFLTSSNSALYFPMANVGMAGEAKIALAKAAQQLAKEKPDGSATEDEILERAKEIRRQELQSKAGDETIEEWARNGAPEDQAGIVAALTSMSSKINVKELEFKKKASDLQSVIKELETVDFNNMTPEKASYYNSLGDKGKELLIDLNENYRYIDNDLSNLSDFNNELDLFKRNYSTLTNRAAQINASVFSIAKGFTGLVKMAAPENYDMYWGGGLDVVSTELEKARQGQLDQVERLKSISDINDINSFMRISGQVLAEQLPQLAVNVYTMGSAKGLVILGASAAGNKYEEIENKDEYTQNQKLLASIAVGLFEVVSEKVEANVLKRALPSARVTAAAANGATRLELDAMKAEFSSGIKGYTKTVIDKAGSAVLNANQEGVSELIAQVGGNMVDKYVLNNKKTSLLDGVKDAYLTGAIMGGAITAVPMIAAKIVTPFINDTDGKIRSNNNKIKELSSSLEKVTSQDSKDIIVESINKIRKENESIINGGVDVISNMTPEEIRDGVANFEEIQKIKSQFLVIKGDKNLTDAEKKAAMSPLNSRYDQLVQKRQEIINKANAIQKQGSGQVPVQPETGISQEVEQGKPQAKPEGATKEAKKEVKNLRAQEQAELVEAIPNIETFKVNGEIDKTLMPAEELAKYDEIYNKYDKLISPLLTEEATPESYVADLQETKNSDPEQYWSVDSVSEEAAREGTIISDEDGGVVVSKDGDIKGLFKRTTSKAKGVAQKLLQKAVEAGGVKLDNFDNYLTSVYKKAGFRVVARVPFNEQYAPEGWNKEKHGTPDVVAMVYDPQGKLNIEERKFEDYDEAMQYRDSFVGQARTPKGSTVAKEQGAPATTKTKLGKNIKKAIAKVFPDLGVSEFKNAKEMKDYVAKKYGQEIANDFMEDDAARAIFDGNNIAEVLVNEELSDETTMPHEIWHGILSKAFGENEVLFDSFRKSIDKALRDNGYDDIADELDAFAINTEYIESDTMASEWLVQFGGMLASARINPSKMNANQKSLLNQLKDIINKFAKKITGQEIFLEDATPENILEFMTGISDSLSRGEDISGFFKAEETIEDTSKIFNSKAQKVGNFEIDYFEDAKDFKKLEEDGYVVQNSSISNIAGEPVAVHQPDSLLVGNVKYNGKQIIDGNGGVYYTLKFGNVWASGKKSSGSGLAKLINKSRKNSSDGKGRLLLVMGSRDKMISSVQGVKASMEVVENLVFDGLIAKSDFRKALTTAGKKYNIDFSGSDSSAAIKKDISDKFMNVNDSSFQRRGDFFSDLITEIGKTESAVKNIKEIQKALGATKNISFSKQGVRNQIGVVLSERLTQGVPSGNYYAYIEVDDDVDIIEDKQHESYPWSIVQKNGKRPVLHVLNERLKATDTITKEDGSTASSAQLGLAQMGMGYGVVSKKVTTKAQKKSTYTNEEYSEMSRNGILFHAGSENIIQLDPNKVKGGFRAVYGWGVYFASTISKASDYGNMITFLNSKGLNLLKINNPVTNDLISELKKLEDKNPYYKLFVDKLKPMVGLSIDEARLRMGDSIRWDYNELWSKMFMDAGYDGFNQGDYEYVVFNIDKANKNLTSDPLNVTTKAQKAHPYIPDEVFEKLTTDENGDVVFSHYSRTSELDEVRPSTGSGSLITSKEEQQALSSVGGLAMYYTQSGQKEGNVGNIQNTVTVDPSKVYYMNKDTLNFYDEAKEQFLDHMNRNNKKRVNYAFSPNYQVAWISKVANENGFDMVISKWRNDYDFRAQTRKTLKTQEEVIPMKPIKDEEISVGDKIFLMGREVTLTEKDENGIYSYEGAGMSGKIPLEKAMRFGNYGPIYKLSSKPQKARLQKEVAGIIDKSTKRGATKEKSYENALNYLQKSKYYQEADDSERETLVRELRSAMGLKEKRNISVGKILGAIKDIVNITAKESTLLKDQIKLESKAGKAAAKEVNDLRKALSLELAALAKAGKITTKQAATIIKRLGSINLNNPTIVDRFVDYMVNVFENANYADQLKTANANINKIKKFYKGKEVQASVYIMAKNFLMLDPKMVDNIDEYIATSIEVMNAVMPVSTPSGVKMRSAADIAKIQEYTEREVNSQTKKMRDELLSEYQFLLDNGILEDTMSYDEIMEIVDSINDEAKPEVLDKGEDVRNYIVKMFNSLSAIGKDILANGVDPVTGESVNLTDDQKALLKKFLNMDIENMSIKEAKLSLEYLSNFITNGITDGIAGLVGSYVGSENLKTFRDTGAKFRKLKLFFSNKLGRLIGEEITNLNILLEQALSGQDRSSLFRSLSGLNRVINGNAAARKQSSDKMTEYVKRFEDVKDFFTLENNVERGILSFLVRTNDSSEELNRRKGLIEQSIAKLIEGNEQEIALGEVAQEVYERIGKNAKTTEEVFSAANKENRDAVNWWINTWGNEYDALKDVSLNIYNADLGKDKNYTPDSYSKIDDETEDEDLGKSAFMLTTKDYTVKKKTGVLMEAKKPNKLNKNRIVSFDFDTNNSRAYEAALVDVNTAEAIRVVDGFINSKEFSKLGSAEDARLVRRRINAYVGEIRGKNFVKRSEMSSLNEALDTIGSIGASMALGSITQPLKQVVPVAMNTLINTGGLLDIKGAFNVDANAFVEKSGMPIANRGLEAFVNVGTANKYIDEAAKSKGEKAVALIKKASAIWLDTFLRRPDVFIARASFLSYYKKKLSEMGYGSEDIDWKNHEPVQSALQYAQDMVDRQQNVSDSALMGDLMTSKDPMKQVVRKTVFTFMNFVLNQKARMYSDIITLKSNSSTKSDKAQAGRSLAALSAEMATYSVVGGAIAETIQYAVSAIMGVDEDEEARRKRLKSRAETVATNVATDFLSPIPVTNGMVISVLNKALDTYYGMTEGEGEEEEGDKFRFFEKDKAGMFDNLGAGGIAASKYMEMFDLFNMAATGEFTQEFNGNKKVKFLRDRDKKAMAGLSFVNLAYGLGLLPAEAGSIVRSATRVAKKRALSEEDNDTRALYKESNAELPDYLK